MLDDDDEIVDTPIRHTGYTPLGEDNDTEDKALNELLRQIPLLRSVIAHLEKKIISLNSVSTLPPTVLEKPDEFMHLAAARKEAVAILRNEVTYLQTKIKTVSSKQ